MTKLLKAAAIAALITGFANTASAFELFAPLSVPNASYELVDSAAQNTLPRDILKPTLQMTAEMKIGVARLDGGRLIPTPYSEEFDWELLARRTAKNSGATIEVMNTGDYLKYIPEIPFHGIDTDNKIDEIRLTAANEGYSHVIIYGIGTDAYWASFGGKALERTGLTIDEDCASWEAAKAKALIVDSFTGKVLGAATADDITYNIGKLADDVERVMTGLTKV
ncbi:MAG: hypothetical protein ABJG88_13635 [Litorimonas sp.]